MLKDYPKEVILKDGTGVSLRPLQKGDEPLLTQMFDRFTESDRWFLGPEEMDAGLIENRGKSMEPDQFISIVAVLEGKIIANATLIRKRYGAESHVGTIRISVDPSFREKRLGTWMLLDLINLAMAMGLETLVMHLIEDKDSSVIRGVKKLDFTEAAVLKDYVKDRKGTFHNLVFMVKRLHHAWDDF